MPAVIESPMNSSLGALLGWAGGLMTIVRAQSTDSGCIMKPSNVTDASTGS